MFRVWKGILGIRDLTKIRCGIRENAKLLDGIRDLTATREAGFTKFGYGMRDFVANQASAKYQSKGLIYILNLLAFQKLVFFNVFLGKKKRNSG